MEEEEEGGELLANTDFAVTKVVATKMSGEAESHAGNG